MTGRVSVEPRGLADIRVRIGVPLLAVFAALVIGAVFLAVTGSNPLEVYVKLLDSAFGSRRDIGDTLVASTPLIMTGVAAAVAFRMLVWNIGGEGQLLVGAIAASGFAIAFASGLPPVLAVALVLAAGAAGGAATAAVAALPRVYLGTNEIITTLMLNFIAANLLEYLILGSNSPWRDPGSPQFPRGRPIPESAQIPNVADAFGRLDYTIVIAVVLAAVAWFLIEKTRWGFELRVVGDSPATARYAGIGVPRKILGVFLMSGAFAGLAGALMVTGNLGRLDEPSINVGLGFVGIIVAALARLNPLAVIPVGILMGALNSAGPSLQTIDVPAATVTMLQGAILIFAVAGEFLIANKVRLRRGKAEPDAPAEVAA